MSTSPTVHLLTALRGLLLTLVSWANLLGHTKAAKLLGETLKEEHAADAKLTKIAESHLNAEAVS